jgi:hypothetical protein
MSTSTFAAAAADAIDYSDDDDEESSESEEVSDISVAVSSEDDSDEDSDEDSDDDDEWDTEEEALFLRDAQDIQNRTSRSVGTAAMEDRRFRGLFGARIEIVLKVWSMLWEDGLRPEKSKPKHLLWTLYFLKVYPREAPGCSAVGGSKGAVDPKTLRKWVWLFIERIAELADEVVSIFCRAGARILAHRRLTSPFLPHPSSASHRSTLRAGSVPTTWATTVS